MGPGRLHVLHAGLRGGAGGLARVPRPARSPAGRSRRMGIIALAHSRIATFKNPEGADYDRFVPDLHAKTWALTHKWADAVLFLNFETYVDSDRHRAEGQGQGREPAQALHAADRGLRRQESPRPPRRDRRRPQRRRGLAQPGHRDEGRQDGHPVNHRSRARRGRPHRRLDPCYGVIPHVDRTRQVSRPHHGTTA